MLTDASIVAVDDGFVRESIVDPNAAIKAGYAANIMPADFGGKLSESQIEGLIEYIKALMP